MPRLRGLIAAAATPLLPDWSIDLERLAHHCGRLLQRGCHGVNLLGTTGEATSFSASERLAAMEAVARAGLPLERFLVGTGAASLSDATRLTAAARDLGFAGALLLPPFYYKNIDPDGLVDYVEAVLARVGPTGLKMYLYHFPQLSCVPYDPATVERLHRAHPEQIVGLKDSSGDLNYAAGLAERLEGFDVFPSAEGALAAARNRFAGCISATLNITAEQAAEGWPNLSTPAGVKAIEAASATRTILTRYPVIPSVKAVLADREGDEAWNRLCPPLRALTPEQREDLRRALKA